MTAFDAIVVGGGHNGLTCATVLAKSGRKVLVLEAADRIGGAARTEEFAPGFRVSSVAHIVNRIHPEVVKALDLRRHWFEQDKPAPTVVLSTTGPVILRGGWGETIDGVPASERAAWQGMRAQLLRYAGILKPFLTRRPPDLDGGTFSEKAALGLAGLSLRRLGREDMRDFLRMMLMNVSDVLDEHLSDERLKGLAAFDAVLGSSLGPRSPTSLLGLYYRLTGEAGGVAGGQIVPVGGMGAVADAFARAAEAAGVTIRAGTAVVRIVVERGRAVGVELPGGDTVTAPIIVSAANPRTTFLELVGPRHLDAGFVRRVRAIRMKGNVAKLHLALDRLPDVAGVAQADLGGRLVIARSADHVETAFNPSKYGEMTGDPVMEITLPSLADSSLAPAGAAVLSAVVPFAPYELRGGWDDARPRLLSILIDALERHAPGIAASVRHAELLGPPDIERRYRMPGGHWHHGELQVDQMLVNRPLHGAAGYDTPIHGLYLGGAGSHPGGGVSGVPGLNAARRVMEVQR